jgi:hypothetical protein
MIDDGGLDFEGDVNFLHQKVLLVSVTSYAAGKPIVLSRGRAFAAIPLFYTSTLTVKLKLSDVSALTWLVSAKCWRIQKGIRPRCVAQMKLFLQ